MKIKTSAEIENLNKVIDEVSRFLDILGASEDVIGRMEIVVEEMFVNVCSYSYVNGKGDVDVECFYDEPENTIDLRITDEGVPFNPFAEKPIDVDEKINDDSVGGLGLYMVKSIVDGTSYERVDNKNIVLLKKKLVKK